MNSHWLRGYGDPPPETVIVVGMSHEFAQSAFESCQIVGHVSNCFGIKNSAIHNTEAELRRHSTDFWARNSASRRFS
jgi:hypothetical protein